MEIKLTKEQSEALSTDKHISLTANAGSGKTFVLSKRFIKLTVDENVPVNRIVSITFTDKAASELYNKISNEVEKQIDEETDKARHRKLKKVRDGIVSANISTIHSFCINVLREYAVEAGIDANFNVADSRELDEIRTKKISEVVEKEYSDNREDIKELVRFFKSFKSLENSLKEYSSKLKQIEKLEETLYNKPKDEILNYFNAKFFELFDELTKDYDFFIKTLIKSAISLTDDKNNFTSLADSLEAYIDKKYFIENINRFWLLVKVLCTQKFKLLSRLRKKLDDNDADFLDNYLELLSNLLPENSTLDLHDKMYPLVCKYRELLLKVIEAINEEKRKNNIIDFDDILIYTRRVLKNDYVKNSLSEKYDCIMIDEYQDTNDIQYEIFLPILEDLKKGNLFVVGDEKQSIYGFRDADLKIFNDTRDKISEATSEKGILKLPHSFRMAPVPATLINTVFTKLFANPNKLFNEVEYTRLICSRNDGIEGKVGFIISNPGDKSEAELVALKILKIAEVKKSFGNIAVICRKRKYFNSLSKEFIKYNIPFNILGGLGFYQLQEIIDIKNILTVLIDPHSDVELVGSLRSPFFNLNDTYLFKISLEKGKSYFQKLKNYSAKDEKLEEIYNLICKLRDLTGEPNITKLLKKIFTLTGYLARIKSRTDFVQIKANIEKLFRIANKFNERINNSLYDFILYLNDSIENDTEEGEADLDISGNSVNILTIHKSKGLEYDTVFVFGCGESYKGGYNTNEITLSKEFGIIAKVMGDSPFDDKLVPPVFQLSKFISDKKEKAEFLRTMYVALTRCKDNLYISGTEGSKGFKSNSFLNYLTRDCGIDVNSNLIANLEFIDGSVKKYEITFDNKIDEEIKIDLLSDTNEKIEYEIYTGEIKDTPNREIISATKLSLFYQCPVKYYLTYEVGFNRMVNMLYKRDTLNPVFNGDEDIEGHFDKQGTIIHSFLEKYSGNENIDNLLSSIIEKEIGIEPVNEKVRINLYSNARDILSKYLESETFKEIKKFDKYFNEFPVYMGLEKFYLFGIIDKLILAGDKAIILDYKTDIVQESTIKKHLENYKMQLMFYGFLISEVYPDKSIELWLSFLRLPDQMQKLKFNEKHKEEFRKVYSKFLSSVKENSYIKNENHCRKCPFYINKRCVKDG